MATRIGAPPPEARSAQEEAATGRVQVTAVGRVFARRGGAAVHALRDVSLHVAPGEIVALVGPSGCGKSTLLELVCRLQAPDGGSVDADPAVLMPQRDLLLAWMDALDNAALALRVTGRSRAEARAEAAPVFAALGLAGSERARPRELSGGMRQRVAFARTLLSGRPVLCLDEPFGALDALTRRDMQQWLAGALAHTPRTVLLVTHDIEEALLLADRVLVMAAAPGRIVAELPVTLSRPRSAADPDIVALRAQAMELLRG